MNKTGASAQTQATSAQTATPREYGAVRWRRDLGAAVAESARAGKPVLILFQEVPGCATCVGYGSTVLSHPLIVEAAEDLFIPVVIHNNLEGEDAKILKEFGEPSWNNPVVRIVGADRRDLIQRVDGDYSARGISAAMVSALRASGRVAPEWLKNFAEESRAEAGARSEQAVYAMHCFWEGEASLGGLDGVLATRTGFQGGQEVVEVTYDPARVSRSALDERAAQMACKKPNSKGAVTPSTKDDKYQLRQTAYVGVPMTPAQSARVNSAIGAGQNPRELLSPRQIALAERLEEIESKRRPVLVGRSDLAAAWKEAERAAR